MTTCHSALGSIGCAVQQLARIGLGLLLLLVGGLMVITFWLLPVGVPLGLLGLALVMSDSGCVASTSTVQTAFDCEASHTSSRFSRLNPSQRIEVHSSADRDASMAFLK